MNPTYYDSVYKSLVGNPIRMMQWKARAEKIAERVTGSVLDVGCGLGLLADMIDSNYHGIDYSPFAISYCLQNVENENATFDLQDILDFEHHEKYDTVVIAEVLEHVEIPYQVLSRYKKNAIEKIIITLPVDMPHEDSHIHPTWDKGKIRDLVAGIGDHTIENLDKHWWIVEVEK